MKNFNRKKIKRQAKAEQSQKWIEKFNQENIILNYELVTHIEKLAYGIGK